ncbi:hypothetical protein [Dyadobacter sp. 50-39]|uniref:hypothetical protein n=1 Tax=Dyadobacter sp. 50-39 TaxID=1895756 RepID=UPI000B18EB1B|nr:hypothetical protein [Dyadobacter sp. 50-39]
MKKCAWGLGGYVIEIHRAPYLGSRKAAGPLDEGLYVLSNAYLKDEQRRNATG